MAQEPTVNLFRRLEQLNGIGAALSRERDIDRLLENILDAAKAITGADGGTLYSVTEDGSALKFEILRTDSLGIRLGGTTGIVTKSKFSNNFFGVYTYEADGLRFTEISEAARQQSAAATNISATMNVIQEITTQTSLL